MVTAATRQHVKLRRQLSEYAETLGVPVSTLKFWIRRGKDHGYPVPLDELEKFPDWWFACMRAPLPIRFRIYDRQVPRSDGSRLEGSSTNVSGSAPKLTKRDFSDVKGKDIEENVKALRRTLEINQILLDEAAAANDERLYNLRQRMHGECFNRLRLAEATLVDLQKSRGRLIDREEVIKDQTKIVDVLKHMRQHMGREILNEVEKNCPKRLRRIFSQLRELLEPAIERVRFQEEQIFSKGLSE